MNYAAQLIALGWCRPFYRIRCHRCGRNVQLHTNNPALIAINATTGRSFTVHCKFCWRKMDAEKKREYQRRFPLRVRVVLSK